MRKINSLYNIIEQLPIELRFFGLKCARSKGLISIAYSTQLNYLKLFFFNHIYTSWLDNVLLSLDGFSEIQALPELQIK